MSLGLRSDFGEAKLSCTSPAAAPASSSLVVICAKREGRIRSAERTEVHLIVKTLLFELTFCPLRRTSGL